MPSDKDGIFYADKSNNYIRGWNNTYLHGKGTG